MPAAVSIFGPVPAESLGFTLPHEHLTIDTSDVKVPPGDYPPDGPLVIEALGQVRKAPRSVVDNVVLDRDDAVVDDLRAYRAAGGRSLVDLTPIGMGRDLVRYRDIARATGVTVVASTGYYLSYGHRGRVAGRSPSSLAEEFVRELTEGVPLPDGSVVRCGAIGEIGLSAEPEPDEWAVLRGALLAARETGAPVWVHVTSLRPVAALLDVVEREAHDPTRVVICHMDYSLRDLALHRRALATGVNVELDLFGYPAWSAGWFVDMPTDAERVRTVLALAAEGYGGQLLLSHDICMKMQLTRWGGFGYAHLPGAVSGLFEALGGSIDVLHRCAVDTPRRLLAWS